VNVVARTTAAPGSLKSNGSLQKKMHATGVESDNVHTVVGRMPFEKTLLQKHSRALRIDQPYDTTFQNDHVLYHQQQQQCMQFWAMVNGLACPHHGVRAQGGSKRRQ
jgi:hypothetical protein